MRYSIRQKTSSLEFCKEQFWYISEMSQHHRKIWKQLDQIVFTYLSVTSAWSRGFPVAQLVKNLPAKAGDKRDTGLIPGLGRSPGEGNGHPFQYSCLENSMDRGVWQSTAHGVTKYQTWLSAHAHTHTHTAWCQVWECGQVRTRLLEWAFQPDGPEGPEGEDARLKPRFITSSPKKIHRGKYNQNFTVIS